MIASSIVSYEETSGGEVERKWEVQERQTFQTVIKENT